MKMKMRMEMKAAMLTALSLLLAVTMSFSQGRGKGHDKNDRHDHPDQRGHNEWRRDNRSNHYDYREFHGNRGFDYPSRPWVTRYHPRMKTRYVYFRDYNVYYDYRGSVYLSLVGRNWVVSAQLPVAMVRVDPYRVVYTDIDYFGDDLSAYHYRRHLMDGHTYYNY
jgi:hypothetical protein